MRFEVVQIAVNPVRFVRDGLQPAPLFLNPAGPFDGFLVGVVEVDGHAVVTGGGFGPGPGGVLPLVAAVLAQDLDVMNHLVRTVDPRVRAVDRLGQRLLEANGGGGHGAACFCWGSWLALQHFYPAFRRLSKLSR